MRSKDTFTDGEAGTRVAESRSRALSLPFKMNLMLGLLTLAMLALSIVHEIQNTRRSINEELQASSRIATQLLERITIVYQRGGPELLADFLRQTGRVRANDIRLYDNDGNVLYASPPSTYKTGRDAPEWYARLVTPAMNAAVLRLNGGSAVISPNPSRAILDGWDDLRLFLIRAVALLLVAYFTIFWMLTRWLAPFEQIRRALAQIANGRHDVRLPVLPGKESGELGAAFNSMAQAVEDNIESRHQAAAAQARLAAQQEFTQDLHRRIESERSAIARELHDELGQSLTAIRSIAAALLQNPDIKGKTAEPAMRLLFDTAGSTFDAMHRLIPRLRPIQLDDLGLADAVRDLVSSLQLANPGLRMELRIGELAPGTNTETETCAYRILQEALTNVVRHAGASQVHIDLRVEDDQLRLTVADNGCGAESCTKPGHFGVLGMRERAEALGGTLEIRSGPQGGMMVDAALPLSRVAA